MSCLRSTNTGRSFEEYYFRYAMIKEFNHYMNCLRSFSRHEMLNEFKPGMNCLRSIIFGMRYWSVSIPE